MHIQLFLNFECHQVRLMHYLLLIDKRNAINGWPIELRYSLSVSHVAYGLFKNVTGTIWKIILDSVSNIGS